MYHSRVVLARASDEDVHHWHCLLGCMLVCVNPDPETVRQQTSSSNLNGGVSSTTETAGDSTYRMSCPKAPVVIETTAALDLGLHFGGP